MYSRCILEGSIPPGFRVGPGVYKSLARRPSCAFQCRTHRNSSALEATGSQMAKLNALVIHTANPPTSLRGPFACIAGLHPCLLCSPIYPITLPAFLAQSTTVLLNPLLPPPGPTHCHAHPATHPAWLSAHPNPLFHPTGTSSLSKPLSPVIDCLWQARLIDPDSQGFDYSVFEQSQK